MFRAALLGVALSLPLAVAAPAHGAGTDVVRVAVEGDGATYVALEGARPNGREAPLASVAPLIPDPLPAVPRAGGCRRGETTRVTITLAGGRSVHYGRCELPEQIDWLAGAVQLEASVWFVPVVERTAIVGATGAETRYLRALLNELRVTAIDEIRFVPERRVGVAVGTVEMKVNDGPPVVAWEAELAARTYNARASQHGLRLIGQLATGRSGGRINGTIGERVVDLGRVRRFVSGTDAEIVELRRSARAIEITVRVPDPAAFLAQRGGDFLTALRKPQPGASLYFAVQDAGGAVVYGGGWQPGHGMFFARADLDACGPVTHTRPFGGTWPPCPA